MIDVGIFDHRGQRVLSIACRKLTLDVLIPEIGQPLWRVCGRRPTEMADEEFQRSQMRQLSGLRVKVCAGDAGKSVILFRVNVDRYQRMRIQRLMNLCLSWGRAELIPARHVQHRRTTNACRFRKSGLDADAVIGN